MRVVLADDSILLREGIARLLAEAGFEVAGQASTADELVRLVGSDTPNVAVVDIRMPPDFTDEGIRAARTIREEHPEVGVLVLSQYAEPGYAIELLANTAEGVGYLLKDRVLDVLDFAAAVQRVGERGTALDPEVVAQLIRLRHEDERLRDLTTRERETLELMVEGRSNEEIADRLVTTQEEIASHVAAVFEKLGIEEAADDHRRALAVLAYLRS
ncbi:MAG: response regulator transcription factor [Actinomycetota bacterium]|nr:response regulator transcription factor [Actinomycetota bacterium]